MLANDKALLVIAGPTCTGKSGLAMELAPVYFGEIINGDSMQVYRHFDVGTAKPGRDERRRVSHHIIDVVEPYEEFNAAIFKDMADRAIGEIWTRGSIPIVVGGTGLYLRALIYGLFKVQTDKALRESLAKQCADDPHRFYEDLRRTDPDYALKISYKDQRRMVRAAEVFRLTGFTMSQWGEKHGFKKPRYRALIIGLRRNRDELYRLINDRVDDMLRRGWVEEVRALLDRGYNPNWKPFSGIGYREILAHLQGRLSYPDMVDAIKKSTRNYAKRQFTWFAKEKGVEWYEFPEETDRIMKRVAEFLT